MTLWQAFLDLTSTCTPKSVQYVAKFSLICGVLISFDQCVQIHLDNEYICLKGTGNDVEPARLTGHVALYLAESTPIKEITLHFRGKARLPPSPYEAYVSPPPPKKSC